MKDAVGGQAGELWVGWETGTIALGVWMVQAMRMVNQFPIGMNKLTLQGKFSRRENVSPTKFNSRGENVSAIEFNGDNIFKKEDSSPPEQIRVLG